MKSSTTWGIALGVGIPGVLILIGLIGLLVKFFMKRCRKKAWDDISALPKRYEVSENSTNKSILPKRTSSTRHLIYESTTNSAVEQSDGHISIPIDENDRSSEQHKQEHTIVQMQRERLNRLKEENRMAPTTGLNPAEGDIQRAIDQAQKEFDESVATGSTKMKHHDK